MKGCRTSHLNLGNFIYSEYQREDLNVIFFYYYLHKNSMLDWDRMTKNDVIGKLELGGHVEGESESRHWNEVINCPRKQIAEWHKLKE